MTTSPTEYPQIHPLVAQIITANATATAAATDSVIDHLEYRVKRAEATLAIVRERIGHLHSGPWQPSQASVLAALWPSDERIDAWVAASATP